jgi:hypothetical protein
VIVVTISLASAISLLRLPLLMTMEGFIGPGNSLTHAANSTDGLSNAFVFSLFAICRFDHNIIIIVLHKIHSLDSPVAPHYHWLLYCNTPPFPFANNMLCQSFLFYEKYKRPDKFARISQNTFV